MNILIKYNNFNKSNIQFLETKQNMLFDGLFTKINYCDDFMVMNGLYLDLPVSNKIRPEISDGIFRQFQSMEQDILQEYMSHRGLTSNVITQKLVDSIRLKYDICESCSGESLVVLKISGIWENINGEIGLSFKLVRA
jgi:hypothetical protein